MGIRNSRYKILVSDRERNTRDAVTEIFRQAGYTVEVAGSGSETIEMLTREAYDLIFCDLDIPKNSGIDVIRMARALNRDARIVVTSSLGEQASRSRMIQEGAFEYLDKPLRKTTLLTVARKALRSARHSRDAAAQVAAPGSP